MKIRPLVDTEKLHKTEIVLVEGAIKARQRAADIKRCRTPGSPQDVIDYYNGAADLFHSLSSSLRSRSADPWVRRQVSDAHFRSRRLAKMEREKHPHPRLTVERAVQEVKEDATEINRRLGLTSDILYPKAILEIEATFEELYHQKRIWYAHYEIGHYFGMNHLIASLREDISLTSDEERLLRAFMERVYYNPPERERLVSIAAAEELAKNPDRSQEIFDTARTVYATLYKMIEEAKTRTDMFHNSVGGNTWQKFGKGEGNGFRRMAEADRSRMEFSKERGLQSKPNYD